MALSVMLAHIIGGHLPGPARYLFTGVPAVFAFFVISGFCIHYPYLDKPLPVGAFLTSRVIRIAAPLLMAMGLAKYAGIRDFTPMGGFIVWSVVCELWYYALYPAFYSLSRVIHWKAQWVMAFIVSMAFVMYKGMDEYGNLQYQFGFWKTWIVCLPSWLLGCVLAEELRRARQSSVPVYVWRTLAAGTASVLFWMSLNTPLKFQVTMNLFAILVFFWMRAEIKAAEQTNVFDRIGVWCYSIYLFHEIFRVFLEPFVPNPFLIAPLAFAGCYVTYRLIEAPSHALARKIFRDWRHWGPQLYRLKPQPSGS